MRLPFGQCLLIAFIAGLTGVLLTLPPAAALVGVVAATWPCWKMYRIDIVDGLRHIA